MNVPKLTLLLFAGPLLVLACDEAPSEDPFTQTTPVTYCNTPKTREKTVNTQRAGTVTYCSDAWVQATSSAPCIEQGACEATGQACVKKPGDKVDECRLPCGDGVVVCPEGTVCLDCTDSTPHCSTTSSCPNPYIPQYNGHGEPCTVVWECTTTADCCPTSSGRPPVCVETETHYTTRENTTTRQCDNICTKTSDCTEGWCCLPFDASDSEYHTSTLVDDGASAPKVCWPPNIYDFCKSATGGTGGGGGGGGSGGDKCGNCGHTGSSTSSCCGFPFCSGNCSLSPCCH